MSKVVIVSGDWAGVSAAVSAQNAGAKVTVLERTDMLLVQPGVNNSSEKSDAK